MCVYEYKHSERNRQQPQPAATPAEAPSFTFTSDSRRHATGARLFNITVTAAAAFRVLKAAIGEVVYK